MIDVEILVLKSQYKRGLSVLFISPLVTKNMHKEELLTHLEIFDMFKMI